MTYKQPDLIDDGWRRAELYWQISHVVGVALPALIFWFAPDDVLTRYPVLARITGVIKEWIPSVRKMAEFSTFPQVAELGMSAIFICAFLLILVFYFGKTLKSVSGSGFTLPADTNRKWHVYFLALVLGPICIAGLFLFGPDTSMEADELLKHHGGRITRLFIGVFLDSRFWSGVIASLDAFSLAGFIVVVEMTFFKHLMDRRKEK